MTNTINTITTTFTTATTRVVTQSSINHYFSCSKRFTLPPEKFMRDYQKNTTRKLDNFYNLLSFLQQLRGFVLSPNAYFFGL